MNPWLAIVGMGLITFAIRISLIALVDWVTIPTRVQQALRYVPAAVLSAIIVPELLMPGGNWDFSLGNGRLVAGVVAMAVAWYTRHTLATIVVGMIVLWLWQGLG